MGECSDQKLCLAKVDGSAQKPRVGPLSRPRRPFWGPLATILDFEASDWSKYGLLGSKNLFSESCSQHPYYYREVISVFRFGGSKTCLPSPEGGRQTKSCSNQKTCFAKVDRSAQVTIEKWPPIFDLGSVSWPQRRCRR